MLEVVKDIFDLVDRLLGRLSFSPVWWKNRKLRGLGVQVFDVYVRACEVRDDGRAITAILREAVESARKGVGFDRLLGGSGADDLRSRIDSQLSLLAEYRDASAAVRAELLVAAPDDSPRVKALMDAKGMTLEQAKGLLADQDSLLPAGGDVDRFGWQFKRLRDAFLDHPRVEEDAAARIAALAYITRQADKCLDELDKAAKALRETLAARFDVSDAMLDLYQAGRKAANKRRGKDSTTRPPAVHSAGRGEGEKE